MGKNENLVSGTAKKISVHERDNHKPGNRVGSEDERKITMKDMNPLTNKICDVCGKLISGDHVEIKTRRGTELHIHYECVRRGENDGKWNEESNP